MSKHPLAAATSLLAPAILTLVTGCAVPTMVVTTTPKDALVWIDGRRAKPSQPGDAIERRRRYYGTTSIHSRQPGLAREQELIDLHYQLNADEPFSPWLFPFDFLLEAITLPFNSDRYRHRVELELQARSTPVGGIRPRNLNAIRERARQAVLAR